MKPVPKNIPAIASLDDASRLARHAVNRMREERSVLDKCWNAATPFRYFVVDDLLPAEFVAMLTDHLPPPSSFVRSKTFRESKRVALHLQNSHPCLQTVLHVLNDSRLLDEIAAVTGMRGFVNEKTPWATSISAMGKGDYLHPHIDNSHNSALTLYRNLNLLFYISPDWKEEFGGSLELWDTNVRNPKRIESRFNRLVVMETHAHSWHSVAPITIDKLRCCASRYLFSPYPTLEGEKNWHVTTFRPRPEDSGMWPIFWADNLVRNTVMRVMPFIVRRNSQKGKLS